MYTYVFIFIYIYTYTQVCWRFISWQQLTPYQDGYLVVIVHIHGNFIVLSHKDIKHRAQCPDFSLSHIILALSQPVLPIP